MFTGIVDHYGKIIEIEHTLQSCRIWVESQFTDLVLGESIAIEGICLTVTGIKNSIFSCDISPETLNVTTAKMFKVSQKINLERALQLSSRLGGHLVAGHVDQVAVIKSIHKKDEFVAFELTGIHEKNMSLITKKGSIAINGVSLTINNVAENGFDVMLIPHTLERTTLSSLQEATAVNIEFDMIARVIVEQCKKYLCSSSQ
jgi:riboflavin synthase